MRYMGYGKEEVRHASQAERTHTPAEEHHCCLLACLRGACGLRRAKSVCARPDVLHQMDQQHIKK